MAGSNYTISRQGSQLVFTINVGIPLTTKCHPELDPEALPTSGAFFTASSTAVPVSTFENSNRVVILISAAHDIGARQNCGLHADTYKCSESGVWSGELTLTRYHG